MKNLFLFLIISTIWSACKNVPDIQIDGESASLSRNYGLQLFNKTPFNGYIVRYSEVGQLLSKEGFFHGKREGASKSWDENGRLIEIRYYSENRKTGRHLGYFPNGQKKFEYHFQDDLPIGTHKEWLENGQLYALSSYNENGQPEGEQKLYFPSGKIRANYVIENGRRYGLLGAKGCMGENEKSNFGLTLKKELK